MKRFRDHLRAQIGGRGGIGEMFAIAFPMIVSQGSDTVMMFVDRLFLSRLGREHLAASMSGGLTAFMMMTFFIGIVGYVNALVAQHLGAGQRHRCSQVAVQGVWLSVLCYPLVLLSIFLAPLFFRTFGHGELQLKLETTYFNILIFGAILSLVRTVLTGFFSGIGRTRIVMVASLVAMVVNVPCNYVLIFGRLGFPALGMAGAAYGTLIGGFCGLLVLLWAYWWPSIRQEFETHLNWRLQWNVLRLLLRYGTPAGTEFLLNMLAFNLVVQTFHSYGRNVAAAVTIAFNWDMVAFFPMIGVNIATMSLVGRNMGAGDIDGAERSAWSGVKLAYAYAGIMMLLFIFMPKLLVSVFASADSAASYAEVVPLAVTFLRLAALYTLADATCLVFGGALRGAGDTFWTMRVSVLIHWLMAVAVILMVRQFHCRPLTAWIVFVATAVLMGIVFFTRFWRGQWKKIRVVGDV